MKILDKNLNLNQPEKFTECVPLEWSPWGTQKLSSVRPFWWNYTVAHRTVVAQSCSLGHCLFDTNNNPVGGMRVFAEKQTNE